MPKTRRVVRKVRRGPRAFEDQLWPVMVAMLILGGYLAGAILAIFPVDESRWQYNAFTYLAALPIAIGAAMVGLAYLNPRTVRRSMQLAAILSLMLNLTLLWVMSAYNLIPQLHIPPNPAQDELAQETFVTPDYHFSQIEENQPRQDHEKPVETKAPKPEDQEIPQEAIKPEEPKEERQPANTPEPEPTVKPNVVERSQASESVPRRSEHNSKLSRQMTEMRPTPAMPTAQTLPTPQTPQRRPKITAQEQKLARESVRQPTVKQQSQAVETPTPAQPTSQSFTRRRTEVTPTVATATPAPTAPRKIETPTFTPRAEAQLADASAAAQQTTEKSITPAATSAQRQQAASPDLDRTPTEVAAEQSQEVAPQVVRRQTPAMESPRVAQAPNALPDRRVTQQPTISEVAADAEPARMVSPARNPAAAPQPSPSQVTRQQTTGAVRERASASEPSPAATPSPPRVASRAVRRATSNPTPTANPSAAPARSPARASRVADLATSPATAASPIAISSKNPQSQPSSRAADRSLAKAMTGEAGANRGRNFDRSEPSPDRPAMVASNSARRERATQASESGPAFAPQEVARVARARAGAEAPSAVFEAQPIESARFAGAEQTSEKQASASGALARADANAEAAPVTASKGDVDVDVGPTQIVANTGIGKAAGGGQPEINFAHSNRKIGRTAQGGGPTVAVAAAVPAEQAAAPAGIGGGAPAAQLEMDSVAASRQEVTGAAPSGGEPSEQAAESAASVAANSDAIGKPQIARAEPAMAAQGIPVSGGGNQSPPRNSAGPPMPAAATAEAVALQTSPESSGIEGGLALATQGTEPQRATTGLNLPATDDEVGAAEAEAFRDSPAGDAPGALASVQRAQAGQGDGPTAQADSAAAGPSRRPTAVGQPQWQVASAEPLPGPTAAADVPGVADTDFAFGLGLTGAGRPEPSAMPVSIEMEEGPGGLGVEFALNVGVNRRNARDDAEEIHFRSTRFLAKRSGGLPGINVKAIRGVDAFARRARRVGDDVGGDRGKLPPETEFAIELGLEFLARHQLADGSWSLANLGAANPQREEEYVDERSAIRSPTAATGLALMSFLGAGYQHKDFKYKDVVAGGLDFLIQHQKENGDLYIPQDETSNSCAWFYSHGIAALALCEAYGMTQDPKLKEPAQKALDFIIASQHKDRGGWRYSPNYGSDTSVTGWLMMAMKAGNIGGLNVPEESFEDIEKWLDRAQQSKDEPHLYVYNPYAHSTETRIRDHQTRASAPMTAVGLLMRLYLGWRRDDPRFSDGADFLLTELPAMGTSRDRKRDTYYWYYATQVMRHMGGEHWKQWNAKLHPLLTSTQIKRGAFAGSWDPLTPVPDRWGPHAGRLYVTCMNLLSLEVDYRLIPLYEETVK